MLDREYAEDIKKQILSTVNSYDWNSDEECVKAVNDLMDLLVREASTPTVLEPVVFTPHPKDLDEYKKATVERVIERLKAFPKTALLVTTVDEGIAVRMEDETEVDIVSFMGNIQ